MLSIRFKIVSLIVLVLLVSIAGSWFITVSNQRANLLESTRRNLAVSGEILNTVVRSIMLSGEAPIAVQTLAGLKSIEEFKEIAIYRVDGTNAFNDYSTIDFVNRYQNRVQFDRTPRQDRIVFENPAFQEVLRTNTPKQVEDLRGQRMEYYFPILNYSQCRSCHGDSPFIRGIAYYQVSTARTYERITAASVTQASVLSGGGLFIALILILMMQRMVIRPVLTIGRAVEVVGTGNLEVSIALRARDELGRLGEQINGMIEGLKEKNRLLVENKVIEARNQENRKYLDNISQGLLLVGPDFRISDQYSASLARLFGRSGLAGTRFPDLVYPDPDDAADRNELEQFLAMIFNNTLTAMDMLLSINPLRDKRLRVPDGSGGRREIVFDAGFVRIFAGDRVESVMVIFEDRTEIVRTREELAAQKERSEAELEQIAAILKAGPEAFGFFAEDSLRTLSSVEAGLDLLGDRETVHRLFRELHSLKGAARYLEFRGLARLANEAEEVLAEVRDSGPSPARREELSSLIGRLVEEVDNVRRINERFRSFAAGSGAASRVGPDGELKETFDSLGKMAQDLARELGKSIRVRVDLRTTRVPRLDELRAPLIHLVRNAVDHGIEPEIERLGKGKDGTGTVTISAERTADGGCSVSVTDDGAGIDTEAVRRAAEHRGLLNPGEAADLKRLLSFLFLPDFSSRKEATDVSGRGVGLDAVQDSVKRMGGRIVVGTAKDRGTRFTIRLPGGGAA